MDTLSFHQYYKGRFTNILHWHHLEQLWESVQAQPEGWYVYLVGETVPTMPVDVTTLNQFLQEINQLLRREHDYDYCGIVYVDDKQQPKMIKIFDPNHLGAACGSGGTVVLPRWLLTRLPPESIVDSVPLPLERKRWWQRLFP